MLVLHRDASFSGEPHSVILIGPDIRIRVLSADRGKAKIGIEAPKGVLIMREEIAGDERRIVTEPRGDR